MQKAIVYFIYDSHADTIKIGTTIDLDNRLYHLRLDRGQQLEVVGFHEGSYKDERRLHKLFDQHALGNEWFRAHADIWEYIKSHTHLDYERINGLEPGVLVDGKWYFTMAQAAEYLGMHLQTLKHHVYKTKKLRGNNIGTGHTIIFTQKQLEDFLNTERKPGRPRKESTDN